MGEGPINKTEEELVQQYRTMRVEHDLAPTIEDAGQIAELAGLLVAGHKTKKDKAA